VQVGDKNTCAVGSADGELVAKILDEYARGFSERNPNFHVFNSVLHLDERTPHLHIDYIPIANGYKNGLQTRNSISVAMEQMGFGKDKDSINRWRMQERQILREICERYGMEIAEETKGRGKSFTPDEYKNIRDEAKEEIKADPEILDEIRADIEEELLSEQQHLVDEIDRHKQELTDLQGKKTTLQGEVKQEQKHFTDMQEKFKPRKDDLEKIKKIKQETKPNILTNNVSLSKAAFDFLINIAEQHARISDTTLAALEKHNEVTAELKRCQSLYLAVATVAAGLSYSDRSKLTHGVQDVLKDIEDWRVVSWLTDDMVNGKPSTLADILNAREAKINKAFHHANKMREYNQPTPSPQKAKKKSHNYDR
jgi:hypothetical protein